MLVYFHSPFVHTPKKHATSQPGVTVNRNFPPARNPQDPFLFSTPGVTTSTGLAVTTERTGHEQVKAVDHTQPHPA